MCMNFLFNLIDGMFLGLTLSGAETRLCNPVLAHLKHGSVNPWQISDKPMNANETGAPHVSGGPVTP